MSLFLIFFGWMNDVRDFIKKWQFHRWQIENNEKQRKNTVRKEMKIFFFFFYMEQRCLVTKFSKLNFNPLSFLMEGNFRLYFTGFLIYSLHSLKIFPRSYWVMILIFVSIFLFFSSLLEIRIKTVLVTQYTSLHTDKNMTRIY